MLMGSNLEVKRILKTLVFLLALIAAIILPSSVGTAQKAAQKLALQDVIDLLTGDVPSDQVAREAEKAGISFQVTASAAKQIRNAGGTDDLIRVLRTLAPRTPAAPVSPSRGVPAPSPPTLLIESSPGQSEVHVDDEPVGMTGPAGRLKLTQLTPGRHSVRISLSGFRNYEESVTLAGGQVTTVAATLQRPEVPQAATPQESPAPPNPKPQAPSAVSAAQAAYGGTLPVAQQPAGSAPPPAQAAAQPNLPPSLLPHKGLRTFAVVYDHGQGGKDYCSGVMSIGDGMIYYKGTKGPTEVHNFAIRLNSIREARRNTVYLVAIGAFHIRLKKGTNYNFVVINQQGQFQPPDPLLAAIADAR